jgi:hypothetical protein
VSFNSAPQEIGRGLRTVYGRDPDGNVVELHEFPPRHPFAAAAFGESNDLTD